MDIFFTIPGDSSELLTVAVSEAVFSVIFCIFCLFEYRSALSCVWAISFFSCKVKKATIKKHNGYIIIENELIDIACTSTNGLKACLDELISFDL